MTIAEADAMKLPGEEDRLGDALRRLPGRLFAVLDGANYPDLPGRLREVGLDYFALYGEETDAPDIRYGPHLVVCPSAFAVEQVRDVSAGTPTVVWWAWPDEGSETEVAVWRHMRRLSVVDVPVGRDEEMIGPPRHGAVTGSGPEEPVFLRHADADVVAALVDVLEPEQTAQLFGEALAILAETPAAPGLALFERPEAQDPGGRLSLSPDQYACLTVSYRRALGRRAEIEFASLAGPGATGRRRIQDAVERAERYRLSTKSEIWDFITMDMRYGARFETAAGREGVLAELTRTDMPSAMRLWRAEMLAQQVRGEDRQEISGTRTF
ncbi:DUF4123 domain-containing protein [Roseicyclus sp. F158]|uniref:DUF4123 domain-containing protein n=1 Tax=Tropicimonas omnivorans TaxID=3075590 RepID=A0ABU3DFZ6_9RHOB|nr:DUF4123 domain-containing protein [Roseicyclus sp. F158]MDT0682641.1 DUF4123 domain-containing protein [Roseicyclus sp. F158]